MPCNQLEGKGSEKECTRTYEQLSHCCASETSTLLQITLIKNFFIERNLYRLKKNANKHLTAQGCHKFNYQFSSVAQSYLTLCDPMNCSTPGLPAHHQLPEFTQTHVHRVGDAIQPSHPLASPRKQLPIKCSKVEHSTARSACVLSECIAAPSPVRLLRDVCIVSRL